MAGATRILEATAGTTRTLELMGTMRAPAEAAPKEPARGAGAGRLASCAARAVTWAAEIAHHAGGLLAILAALALWGWIVAGVLAPLSGALARIDGAGTSAPPALHCPVPQGALASAAGAVETDRCR